jgi:hypothetical protein
MSQPMPTEDSSSGRLRQQMLGAARSILPWVWGWAGRTYVRDGVTALGLPRQWRVNRRHNSQEWQRPSPIDRQGTSVNAFDWLPATTLNGS